MRCRDAAPDVRLRFKDSGKDKSRDKDRHRDRDRCVMQSGLVLDLQR